MLKCYHVNILCSLQRWRNLGATSLYRRQEEVEVAISTLQQYCLQHSKQTFN